MTVSESDFSTISARIKKIVKQKQPFERMEVSRAFANELFAYSEFKQEMLSNIPADEKVTLYRCGSLIDLCRGPHVPHTGMYHTQFQHTWTLSDVSNGTSLSLLMYGY